MSRPLVLAAHGTASAEGRALVEDVAARVGGRLGVPASVGYVDVCGPSLAQALARHAPVEEASVGEASVGEAPVVVPFFLASGYHVRHDIPAAVGAELPEAVVTSALGVADEVVSALATRVREVAPRPGAVVLTTAGTSVRAAREEVEALGRRLADELSVPVAVGFLTGDGPDPDETVARLLAAGQGPVVMATHLLAPGFFLDRARRVAAARGVPVTRPLGSHARVLDLVERRYRTALGATVTTGG